MDVQPGMRVVRGPDWKWGEQDGGEGGVGTVVECASVETGPEAQRAVIVQWDNGHRCSYRSAVEGQYDLLLLDNDPVGCKHYGIKCDVCRSGSITGMRWKCVKCPDTDLCSPCYNEGKHALDHEFFRIVHPDCQRVAVTARVGARQIMARGMFPQAEVVRGHDWLWGDQDGGLGKRGTLLSIRGWENDNCRSIAEVEWTETGKCNVYRIGHKGKVDLKCVKVACGGYYYYSHLPLLGAPQGYLRAPDNTMKQKSETSMPPPSTPMSPHSENESLQVEVTNSSELHSFAPGDNVRVQLEVEIFKMMQEGHGDYDQQLLDNLSDVGTVHAVLDNGDVRVKYSGSRVYTINHSALSKVAYFAPGDVVRVLDDIATVHSFQENHGGWVDDMALSLGQVGRVMKVFPTGDVRVAVNSRTWTYNPQCLSHSPNEELVEPQSATYEPEGEDIELQMKLLTMLDNPAVIVAAAASGDVDTLRDFLRKHPSQVNTKAAGKAAIHCACAQGNVDVVKCILEFSPDLEIEDEDGDRPIHLSAYSDEDEVAQLLVAENADVNSKNNKGATALIIAAVKGHHSVLRILANHPAVNLHEPDTDGDTALHCAVLARKNESINILLDAGADPTLLNFRLFTPIHEAARIGFLSAVDHFIRRYPAYVNIVKDDGFTPLHLSAINNHIDVVTSFAEHELCDLNVCTREKQTPLHLAVHQGHLGVVERLVGYGANLNVQDSNGDTPLHIALVRDNEDVISSNTPQLKKIKENMSAISGDDAPGAVTACFLVQEGADMNLQNSKGLTPLQLSPSHVLAYGGSPSSFHGCLKSLPNDHESELKGSPENSPLLSSPSVQTEGLYSGGQHVCFLCEAPVDVRFEPCGHALMCHTCANRAKKCPKCKKHVKTTSKLRELCVMCNEEASVTVSPCGHMYCQECCKRLKVCFECRSSIESKHGLGPEPEPKTSVPKSSSGLQPSCVVCLTEPTNTALQCGHLLCWDCAQRVDHCPVCRKFVHHRIRLFQ